MENEFLWPKFLDKYFESDNRRIETLRRFMKVLVSEDSPRGKALWVVCKFKETVMLSILFEAMKAVAGKGNWTKYSLTEDPSVLEGVKLAFVDGSSLRPMFFRRNEGLIPVIVQYGTQLAIVTKSVVDAGGRVNQDFEALHVEPHAVVGYSPELAIKESDAISEWALGAQPRYALPVAKLIEQPQPDNAPVALPETAGLFGWTNETRSKKIIVSLTPSEHEALNAFAKTEKTDVSKLVREGLALVFDKRKAVAAT